MVKVQPELPRRGGGRGERDRDRPAPSTPLPAQVPCRVSVVLPWNGFTHANGKGGKVRGRTGRAEESERKGGFRHGGFHLETSPQTPHVCFPRPLRGGPRLGFPVASGVSGRERPGLGSRPRRERLPPLLPRTGKPPPTRRPSAPRAPFASALSTPP